VRIFYASLLIGLAGFIGGVGSALAHEWLMAGVLVGVFVAYCLVAPRLVRRIPPEAIQRQSRLAEQLTSAVGQAVSGGWNPRRKNDG
jgi:hypothetical protein